MAAPRIRPRLGRDEWLMGGGLLALALYLAVTLLVPLVIMLAKSLEDSEGAFVGLANFALRRCPARLATACGFRRWPH